MRKALVLAAAGSSRAGCADILLPPDPGSGPEQVARAAWEEIDAYYPWFALKGVAWDAVARPYLDEVGPDTRPGDLFTILSGMIDELRDGHLALQRPAERHSWEGWFLDYPVNYLPEAVADHLRPPFGHVDERVRELGDATGRDGLPAHRVVRWRRGRAGRGPRAPGLARWSRS